MDLHTADRQFGNNERLTPPIPKPGQSRLTAIGSIELPAATISFARNEEIYGEEEPAEFLYKVLSGAVRTFKILSDGRRQIDAFYFEGDVFGLECGRAHRFSAEAIVDADVALVKRSLLEAAASRQNDAAPTLCGLTRRELTRAQDHLLLLGRRNAQERLMSFLLELLERGNGGPELDLPMSRIDIADYLGLTIETVSRMFTQLERDRAILLPSSRHVVLRNVRALKDANA